MESITPQFHIFKINQKLFKRIWWKVKLMFLWLSVLKLRIHKKLNNNCNVRKSEENDKFVVWCYHVRKYDYFILENLSIYSILILCWSLLRCLSCHSIRFAKSSILLNQTYIIIRIFHNHMNFWLFVLAINASFHAIYTRSHDLRCMFLCCFKSLDKNESHGIYRKKKRKK